MRLRQSNISSSILVENNNDNGSPVTNKSSQSKSLVLNWGCADWKINSQSVHTPLMYIALVAFIRCICIINYTKIVGGPTNFQEPWVHEGY